MTVHSKEVPSVEIAKDMEIRIGHQANHKTIVVISLDDYDFVIGLDFIDRINALVVPFTDCLCILDSQCQYVVPVKRIMGKAR